MKIYEGRRDLGVVLVYKGTLNDAGMVVDRKPLPPRNDLRNHSPDGFEWGYGGSGPSQLALALCADALGDDRRAQEVYQHYKWAHVAKFPTAGWRTTAEQVIVDVNSLEGNPS